MSDTLNVKPLSADAPVQYHPAVNAELSPADVKLQSLLVHIIDNNIRGRLDVLKAAREFGISKSYSSIQSKLNKFKLEGAASLSRKEKSDKGTAKSFSHEVLLKLQKIFTSPVGGCAVRAYEDTHKWLRSVSREFIITSTGECLSVVRGYLCDASNNQILSQYTTRFLPGIYKLKPEAVTGGECELSIGSYASAARFLKSIKDSSADALFMQRMGLYDYRNKRQHTMKLDYSKLQPSELIIGDGKKLDVVVISDDYRRVYRPWLMGWYDAATRRYCYQLSLSETSEAIANSLAVAVKEWGVPAVCKHDNGKSYLSGRFDQMKRSLGIRTSLATVKLARAKPIESFHNILDQLTKTLIGYTGNKYQDFPEDTRTRLKYVLGNIKDISRVEKMFKTEQAHEFHSVNVANPEARLKSSKRRLMHVSELIEVLNDKIEEYHDREHGGLKKDSIGVQAYKLTCADELIKSYGTKINTPNGRYEYKSALGFTPAMANPAVVAVYAMNYELRTVQLKTGINFNNEEYYSPKLRNLAGERVLIRFTHSRTDVLYVFHSAELQKVAADKKYVTPEIIAGLKYVCLADLQRAIHYNDESFKDQLNIQREEERRLKSSFKPDFKSNVHSITGIDSQIPEIENDEARAVISKLEKTKPFKKYKDLFDD